MNKITEENINDLKFRDDLYPRKFSGIDNNKVIEYSQNIDLLPPIKINQNKEIINGVHRWKAHIEAKKEKIKVEIITTKDDSELLSLSLLEDNASAVQLSYKDKRGWAIELTNNALDKQIDISLIKNKLVKELSVSEDTYNKWTKDIREKFKEQIKEQIVLEYLKAELTQQQVANKFQISPDLVAKISNEIRQKINLLFVGNPEELFKTYNEETQKKFLKEYYDEDKDKNLFKNNTLDFNTFYTRLTKQFEISKFDPYIYNIWNLQKNDSDNQHFGKFPYYFMENLLYYYTKPFDTVFDPFAGGGTTIDCCKKWYRRYYATDLTPIEIRNTEIKQHDITTGLPPDIPSQIDFVFLDPPYWKQAENQYSKKKEDLANIELEKFYESIENIIKELKKKLKTGAKVAFVISPTQWKMENKTFEDHSIKIHNLFLKHNFKQIMRYCLPYSTQQYNAQQVNYAKENKTCLNIIRDLEVFEK